MTVIALRPATAADSEFCFQLHKAAMGEYVAAIWGWDEQRQRDSHTRKFTAGHWQIITADAVHPAVSVRASGCRPLSPCGRLPRC